MFYLLRESTKIRFNAELCMKSTPITETISNAVCLTKCHSLLPSTGRVGVPDLLVCLCRGKLVLLPSIALKGLKNKKVVATDERHGRSFPTQRSLQYLGQAHLRNDSAACCLIVIQDTVISDMNQNFSRTSHERRKKFLKVLKRRLQIKNANTDR